MTELAPLRRRRAHPWALALATLAVVTLAGTAEGHGYQVGALKIGHPWARPALAGRAGGAYLTVTNTGAAADSLVGATSPAAARVTIHEMRMKGAVMSMRPVTSLAIAPGATLALAPGGYHLMLEGLKRDLKLGERVPATLTFARAGKVVVELVIQGGPAGHANH